MQKISEKNYYENTHRLRIVIIYNYKRKNTVRFYKFKNPYIMQKFIQRCKKWISDQFSVEIMSYNRNSIIVNKDGIVY